MVFTQGQLAFKLGRNITTHCIMCIYIERYVNMLFASGFMYDGLGLFTACFLQSPRICHQAFKSVFYILIRNFAFFFIRGTDRMLFCRLPIIKRSKSKPPSVGPGHVQVCFWGQILIKSACFECCCQFVKFPMIGVMSINIGVKELGTY